MAGVRRGDGQRRVCKGYASSAHTDRRVVGCWDSGGCDPGGDVVDVEADEVTPFHVGDAPLEHESAHVTHGHAEVGCDLLDRNEAWQAAAWACRASDGQGGGLRCHERTMDR